MDHNDRIDTLIDPGTRLLGISIEPAWQDGIRFHLETSLRLAAIVSDVALPDDTEPAPVFRP